MKRFLLSIAALGFAARLFGQAPVVESVQGQVQSVVEATDVELGGAPAPDAFAIGGTAAQCLQTTGAGAWQWGGCGLTGHALLGATHTDAVTHTVVQGDIMIGNSTPAWTALPIGSANRVLYSNGTTASWSQFHLLNGNPTNDTASTNVARGSVIVGNSVPLWSAMAVGSANQVLHTDGTDTTWQSLTAADITTAMATCPLGNHVCTLKTYNGATSITSAAEHDLYDSGSNTGYVVSGTALNTAGNAIRVRCMGKLQSNDAPTLTIKVYYGASAIYSSITSALGSTTNPQIMFYDLWIAAVAANSQIMSIQHFEGNGSTTSTTGWGSMGAANNFDRTGGVASSVTSNTNQNLRITVTPSGTLDTGEIDWCQVVFFPAGA